MADPFTRFSTALAFVLLLASNAANAGGDTRRCQQADAASVPLVESEAAGPAQLCMLPNRLHGAVTLHNLTPNNAYTVWWVYIDRPDQCTGETPLPVPLGAGGSDCDFADFEGDKPLGVFGRMDSGIAPRNGRLRFSGRFRGMQPSRGSEVWLFVFGHGGANYQDGAALARQLLTPEDPNTGAPHLGNVVDGLRGYPVSTAVFKLD